MRWVFIAFTFLSCPPPEESRVSDQVSATDSFTVAFKPGKKKKACYLPHLRIDTYKDHYFKCVDQANLTVNTGVHNRRQITDPRKFMEDSLKECAAQANFYAYHTYCWR